MTVTDFAVFAFYLAGMVAIGVFYARRNTDLRAMFAANGQSPWWVAGLSGFMTMFSAGTFVVWGGLAYREGLVAVIINLGYGVAALVVGVLAARRWKDLGVDTPAEFVTARFGTSVVSLYTVVFMVFRVIGAAIALYALAVLLAALMPLEPEHWLADGATGKASVLKLTLIFGIIIVAYTMAGGLWAVLMTDVLQFVILNLAVLFILPLVLSAAGGPGEVFARLPDGFFALTGGGYGPLFIVGWTMIHIFMIGGEWAFAQRFISVPTPRAAQKSAYLFGALYLISPWIWLAPPLLYRAINPDANPEQAYILAAQAVLPVGLVGLVVAAMFSATASLISSQLNVFAGALSGFVRARRPMAARREVAVGRGFTVLIGVLVVGLATAVPYLGGAERLIVVATSLLVGPLLAPSLWGLLSPRITAAAVWACVGAAVVIGVVVKIGFAPAGLLTQQLGLSAFADMLIANRQTVDLMIGVVTPVVVLSVAHHLSPAPKAPIVALLSRRASSQTAQIPGQDRVADTSPGFVVSIALGASAVLMTILAILTRDGRGELFTFAAILGVVSCTAYALARRRPSVEPMP